MPQRRAAINSGSMLGGYCRQEKIDVLKGILILLVVIGHVLPGTLQENFVRYFIYSFHMPVFFAVSGYLVNVDSLKYSNLKEFLLKYGYRVIIPWLVAVQVYFILNCALGFGSVSVKGYLSQYIYPFYHLWYVIGYVFCICCLRWAVKIYGNHWVKRKGVICFVIFSVIIGVLFKALPYVFLDGIISKVIGVINYSVRPQNLMFFSVGLLLRFTNPNIRGRVVMVGAGVLAVIGCIMFAVDREYAVTFDMVKWLFSLTLILSLYAYREGNIQGGRLLKFCGVYSFPIYLWHIIGRQLALYITASAYNWIYYISCVVWFIALLVFIKWASSGKASPIRILSGV